MRETEDIKDYKIILKQGTYNLKKRYKINYKKVKINKIEIITTESKMQKFINEKSKSKNTNIKK